MQARMQASFERMHCRALPACSSGIRALSNPVGTQSVTCSAHLRETDMLSGRRASFLSISLASLAMLQQQYSATAASSSDWSSPGLDKKIEGPIPYKTESGIKVQELTTGEGPAPQPGDKVLIDYVLRRANGYFIYATVEGVSFQPSDIPVGPVALTIPASPEEGPLIAGLAEILLRMQQGGKLRAFIPPELGYKDCKINEPQPPTFATSDSCVTTIGGASINGDSSQKGAEIEG